MFDDLYERDLNIERRDYHGDDWISVSINEDVQKESFKQLDDYAKSLGAVKHDGRNWAARDAKLNYVIPSKNYESFYFHIPIGKTYLDSEEIELFAKIRISTHEETDEIYIGNEDEGFHTVRLPAMLSYDDPYIAYVFAGKDVATDTFEPPLFERDKIEGITPRDFFLDDYFSADHDYAAEDFFYEIDERLLFDKDFWDSPDNYLDADGMEFLEGAIGEFDSYVDRIIRAHNEIEDKVDEASREFTRKYNDAIEFLNDVFKYIKKDLIDELKDKERIIMCNGLSEDHMEELIENMIIEYR